MIPSIMANSLFMANHALSALVVVPKMEHVS